MRRFRIDYYFAARLVYYKFVFLQSMLLPKYDGIVVLYGAFAFLFTCVRFPCMYEFNYVVFDENLLLLVVTSM